MKTIVIAINDLIFATTVRDAVVRAGMAAVLVRTEEEAWEAAADEPKAAGMVVDLNDTKIRAIELITQLKKKEETNAVPILSFVPHVQTELRKQAEDAGSELVVARSGFASSLKEWLRELNNR